MMAHLSIKDLTCTEKLQEYNENQNALDTVVDPCTEFQLQCEKNIKTPNDAYNLTTKTNSTSIRYKATYKIDGHELPRVHKTSSSQSVVNMLRKDNHSRNLSESSEFNGSDKTINSSMSRNLHDRDNISLGDVSLGTPTPTRDTIDSPIFPHFVDRLETASNISLTSNLTDIPGSNISSMSDLTGYEDELFQIKKLINNNGSTSSIYQPDLIAKTNKHDISVYETRIEELESQLNETLGENEKYKFDLNDLENKIEMIWQEKFQEVMRQKAQCEGQLENVRKQYECAVNEKEKILNNFKYGMNNKNTLTECSELNLKLKHYEKQNNELQSRLALSSNETKQWQSEFLKTEADNEKLRIKLQELKSEIDSKNSVLFGLKNKITEQHIEIQNHIQGKLKLNNHITTLNNDIESVKKSEKWYREQLHNCQLVKSNIQQEIMSTQTNLITATQKIETMKMEISHWKCMCEEIQRKAMKEKEILLRKVEMIQSDILEREAILKCTQSENETKIEMNYVTKPISEEQAQNEDYQYILQEYEDQLTNIKKLMAEQNLQIDKLQKQNTDYLVRLTSLQKSLNEKEISSQTLENRNEDLEMKCNSYSEDVRTKDAEILELRNQIVSLEVGLHAANREKQEIDEVVKNIREDFSKFMKCYQGMKEKLEEKTKMIAQFENEKQELFMENNWRVCEIESLQQKVLSVKNLQAEIMEMRNACNQLTMEKDEVEQMNISLRNKNDELVTNCDNLNIKINTLEENLSEMNEAKLTISNDDLNKINKEMVNLQNENSKLFETLRVREDQLVNQTKNCELLNSEIEEKEKLVSGLQRKLLESVNSIEIGNAASSDLEQFNCDLQLKVRDLNKKLIDANSVIEQFNTLCRNSELEKHNLSNQLNLLKTQLQQAQNVEENSKFLEIKNTCVESTTQTDFIVETLENNFSVDLENIKSRLSELISDNNNVSNNATVVNNMYNSNNNSDLISTINEYLNKILSLKENQMKQLETSEKVNKMLKMKVLKLKNKIEKKISCLNEKCARLDKSYYQIEKVIDSLTEHQSNQEANINSIGVQTNLELNGEQSTYLIKEIKDLKTLLRVNEMERQHQYKRYETNNRTLLKKVKEHMRGRKIAENKLSSLEETYNLAITEINNAKIINNRLELEVVTFKSRCDEYKIKCDKFNEDILKLEKEKNQIIIDEKPSECLNCLDKDNINRQLQDVVYKLKELAEKSHWYEKEISDKEKGITECKKQLFNEKLQVSALKKQLSSVQMCLDNANEQLDNKQVEFGHLKSVVEKVETNEKVLTDQLENAHIQYQECKRKYETTRRLLEEKTAKDEILADEIKTLSCHLHQKTLEMSNLQNKYTLLESQISSIQNNHLQVVDELKVNLVELQNELDAVQNDKFFLQRLSADLKMSLQGTVNQNKVLKLRLETLENETKNLTEKLHDSLPSIPSPSKIDEDYINRLLQQSTVMPHKPLINLRSCLDSLKHEMATLQREIISKTQSDI